MLIDFQEKIKKAEFQDLIKTKEKLIIAFYTEWCSPCSKLKEIMEILSESDEYKKIGFYSINLGNSRWLNDMFAIHSVPIIFFIKNAHLIYRLKGISKKSDIITKMDELF